jgi:hypothetical protein
MKKHFFLFLSLFSFSFSFGQDDQITEMLDSLETVFFFKDVKLNENVNNKYAPGQIPKFDESTYNERFNEMAKNSPFNYVYNPVVRNYIDRYTRNPKSAATILALSSLYFPLYEKYLNQYKIPLELKYLSVVESALNPTAKSHCGASGLWQFMYGTGKVYNLEINSYVDERFDPEKETIAACRYLKDLYEIYHDWSLAIAAYNCGPGNVNKAMKRAGKKDFWEIRDYLPKETQNYVPAFMAASYIMNYNKEHNMSVANIKFLYDDLDKITVNKKTSLSNISFLLDIPLSELKYLNPKYFMGVVPGNNDIVIVPKDKALEWIDYENKYTGKLVASNTTVIEKKPASIKPTQNNSIIIKEEKKKKEYDPFGTTKKSEIIITENNATEDNSESNRIENDSSMNEEEQTTYENLVCEVYGNQTVGMNSTILMRNTEAIQISEDVIVPANSIIKGRIIFKENSILIKTLSAKTSIGDVRFISQGEIREKTTKNKILIEDGYTIVLKVELDKYISKLELD